MHNVTTHQAKTHLSSLIRQVLAGEEVVICRGDRPVARLVPVDDDGERVSRRRRPMVGTGTSAPIAHDADAFAPLGEAQLEELGL